MADVARSAAVSRSTVSKALRNDPTIPESTCQRIQKLAAEIGYRPNALVSSLMAQLHTKRPAYRTPILTALVPHAAAESLNYNHSAEQFLAGARRRAAELGYEFELKALPNAPADAKALSRQMRFRGCVGVIVLPMPSQQHEIDWDFTPFAATALGRSLQHPRLHHVSPHHSHNITLLFNALREKGFTRIGFAMSRPQSAQVQDAWLSGYARLLMLGEPATLPPLIVDTWNTEQVSQWLLAQQPEVIICKELWRLPKILKEIPHASQIPLYSPGVPTHSKDRGIDERRDEVGATALEMVVNQIHTNVSGVPDAPRTVLIPGELRL
jgi:DNA-binding LacI/PurR family transcriptional regulator